MLSRTRLVHYMIHLELAITIVILSGGILPYIAFSQTSNNSQNQVNQTGNHETKLESIGWDKIILLIGATGIISAVSTGLFNKYNTNKQLEKQQENTLKQIDKQQQNALSILARQLENTIKQMEYDRKLKELQEKLNLYATFSFDLKRLRELLKNAQKFTLKIPREEVNEIAKQIGLLIRPKFYLLGSTVVQKWLELNRDYTIQVAIQELIDSLMYEYNTDIKIKYKELTGSELPNLQD